MGRNPRLFWVAATLLGVACGAPAPTTPASTARPATSAPAPAAEPEALAEGGCPQGMVAVPGGKLLMGSAEDAGEADERPRHSVVVAAFCLSAREVTVAEYTACEKNKACAPLPKEVRLLTPVSAGEHGDLSARCTARMADNADLPATCVGFDDAERYCSWKGHRLPTEVEWEWAATGGEDELEWPWGARDPHPDSVCYQRDQGPCRVGSKPPGAFELLDLVGNVAEWTATDYAPYPGSKLPAPKAAKKVVRGGSWETGKPADLRPRRRAAHPREYRDITLGFRCAAGK